MASPASAQTPARAQCTALHPGADLAAALDPGENAFVAALLRAAGAATGPCFLGAAFAMRGAVGAWFLDAEWYASAAYAATFPSSPSWPTAANGFYSNWPGAGGGPADDFGCVTIDAASGAWGSASCQQALPFVCAYLDDGSMPSPPPSTGAPLTPAPGGTAAPPTPAPPPAVACAPGWTAFARSCYRVVVTATASVAPSTMETSCHGAVAGAASPLLAVHASSVSSLPESRFLGDLVAAAGRPRALLGASFVQRGASGLFLDWATPWSAALAAALWAAAEPATDSGCVAIDADGSWFAVSCLAPAPAFVCRYDFDELGVISSTSVSPQSLPPTPAPSPTAQPQPPLSPALRIAALGGFARLVVLQGTRGTYRVASLGGPVDRLLLLFAPLVGSLSAGGSGAADAAFAACNASRGKQAYTAEVLGGAITIDHNTSVPSGVVCVSDNGGATFVPTNVTYAVLPGFLTGFVSLLGQPFVPAARLPDANATAAQATLAGLPRRSSGMLQLVGTAPHGGSGATAAALLVRAVRFAASDDCAGSAFTFGDAALPTTGGLVGYGIVDVQVLDPALADPYSDAAAAIPPSRFVWCVSVGETASDAAASPQPLNAFTAVPGLAIDVLPAKVELAGLFVVPRPAQPDGGASQAPATPTPTPAVAVAQFSSPRLGLLASGLTTGMLVLLSFTENSCARLQPVDPSGSGDDQVPAALGTIATVAFAPVDTDANATTPSVLAPYVQLTLNHTGMWGAPAAAPTQTLFLCLGYATVGPFVPTPLRVVVQRQRVTSLSTTDSAATTASLVLNVGFAGVLRLGGVDPALWSLETLSNAQVAFALAPPSGVAAPALQCADSARFYKARALNVVAGPAGSRGSAAADDPLGVGGQLAVVVPPWFLSNETTARMRVCLSIPHPFDAGRRVFLPTDATLDVVPVALLFVGPFGAGAFVSPAAAGFAFTEIALADDADNVVLPLSGYGLRSDQTLFLSPAPCFPESVAAARLNLSLSSLYDVPRGFRAQAPSADAGAPPSRIAVALVLTRDQHTAPSVADAVFGAERAPLFVCLLAPETSAVVVPTAFKLVVRRPRLDFIARADSAQPPAVVYGSYTDLLVGGFGLAPNRTLLVPALDCADESTFLWPSPLTLAPVPSTLTLQGAAPTTRADDRQSGSATWFLPLNQAQTCRIGSAMPADGADVVRRFSWCVRYDRAGAAGFVPTGVPYALAIPRVAGVLDRLGNVVRELFLTQMSAALGDWQRVTFVGPLIDAATATGNPLFMFLSEPELPCGVLQRFIVAANQSADRFVLVSRGVALFLPSHTTQLGRLKLCASELLPDSAAGGGGAKAAESDLQFLELYGVAVTVQSPSYDLFAINGSSAVAVRQGEEWVLPVDGNGLSERSRLRLLRGADRYSSAVSCANTTVVLADAGDIVVRRVFPGMRLFGRSAAGFYVVLERAVTSALAPDGYLVCFRANQAVPWALSPLRLAVAAHVRRPTLYSYFADDGAHDVVRVSTAAPSRVVLPLPPSQRALVVGVVGREVALQLWCAAGSAGSAGSGAELCGNSRRVMFMRPLPDPDADPCFVDDEDSDAENTLGPFVVHFGVVTLPRLLRQHPNASLPWALCVETAPDYWTWPRQPAFALAYSGPAPAAFRAVADTVDNTTVPAVAPAGSDAQLLTVRAGGVTAVTFVNGFGVQYGQLVRFGPGCSAPVPATAAALANPLLLLRPLLLTDDLGALVIPSEHFARPEALPSLPMCLSNDGGATFQTTPLSLRVLPSDLVPDSSLAAYNDRHAITEALMDTLVVPRGCRGVVDLGLLRNAATGVAVPFGAGAVVMLSSDCAFSAQGLPTLLVVGDAAASAASAAAEARVALSQEHTAASTPRPLRICVRRVVEVAHLGALPQTVFATPMFVDTGLAFKVADLRIDSVSVHDRAPGAEAARDVGHVVFQPLGRGLLLPLRVLDAPSSAVDRSDFVASLDDVNVLAFFDLMRFRLGRPCHAPDAGAPQASIRTAVAQRATFAGGAVAVAPDAREGGLFVPLRAPPGLVADPWAPHTVCVAVDGGRHFVSVGIAYVSAAWAPTLLAASPVLGAPATVAVGEGSPAAAAAAAAPAFTDRVVVYELTSAYVGFTDARFDSRALVNAAPDYVDSDLTQALNAFAVAALWTGFVGGVGYSDGQRMYLPAEVVDDGDGASSGINVSASAAYVPVGAQSLGFYFDAAAPAVATGITVTIAPMGLQCLEGGDASVVVSRQEPGRRFAIPATGPCNAGINDGAMFRLAVSDSCTAFGADVLVDQSLSLLMPFQLAFLPEATFRLCLKKFLPVRLAAPLGREAVYLPTRVLVQLSHRIVVDQVNDISAGTIAATQGDAAVLRLAGSGVTAASLVVALATAPRGDCGSIAAVGSQGDPLDRWFPVLNSVAVVPASATAPGIAAPRRVCYSANDGLTFTHVANGLIFFAVVPPTVTAIRADSGARLLYDPLSATPSVLGLARLSATAPRPLRRPTVLRLAPALPPAFYFNATAGVQLLGNGVGRGTSRRADPLHVALVDAAVQGSACDGGPLAAGAAAVLLSVDARTGAVANAGDLAALPPGTNWLACTSSDGLAYFSGNSPAIPRSPVELVAASVDYSTDAAAVISGGGGATLDAFARTAFFLRADAEPTGNFRADDLTMVVAAVARGGANRTAAGGLALAAAASAVAATLAIDASLVVLQVTANDSATPATLPFRRFQLAIKLLGPRRTIAAAAAAATGTSQFRITTVPELYLELDAALVGNASSILSSLFTVRPDTGGNVSTTPLFIDFVFSNGVALRDPVAAQYVAPQDADAVAALLALLPDGVNAWTEGADTQSALPKPSWAAIPVLLILPLCLVVATYHAYRRYFDVSSAEELQRRAELEARQREEWLQRRSELRERAVRGGGVFLDALRAKAGLAAAADDSKPT